MNDCFFCGPTKNPLTEEHVWPQWVSRALKGRYGSDHFIHIRSTGNDTTGLWKNANLDVTTTTVCDHCNNVWLGNFENLEVMRIAEPLITNTGGDIITPQQQWTLAAWAYKMGLLLEIAPPEEERRLTFSPAERHEFRQTQLANEHVRIFVAKYRYGQHPAHAHQKLHTLTRRNDGLSFDLKIATITAGWLAMQIIAVRYAATSQLAYAVSELEIELLGKTKTALAQIWPAPNAGIRWTNLDEMTQQDVEDWTEMWEKAQGLRLG